MTHYNPMLEKLQRQIQDFNKENESRIEKVARRQNLITLGFVVFNIIVFITLESLFGDKEPLFANIPNVVLNFVATLVLLMVSFPLASKFAKRNMENLQLNEEAIEPKMQYAGTWEYHTEFRIQSPDDGSEEYKRLADNMCDYKENGISQWTQNVFELKIDFAGTAQGKEHPQVSWHSDPISYDEHEIRWSFTGKIWWKDDQNYANEFSGIEYYTVRGCDDKGRPCYLEGHLVGTVLVGKRFYVVDALSEFRRK